MRAINHNDNDDDVADDFYSALSRLASKKKTIDTFCLQDQASTSDVDFLSQSIAARSFNSCVIIASIAPDPFIPLLLMFTL